MAESHIPPRGEEDCGERSITPRRIQGMNRGFGNSSGKRVDQILAGDSASSK